jgi:high-affinity K+ transport system ATPase subunit B
MSHFTQIETRLMPSEEEIRKKRIQNEERAKRNHKNHLIETLTRAGYQIQDNESDKLTVKKNGKVLGVLDLESLKGKITDSFFMRELKRQYALATITHTAERLGLTLGEITETQDGQIEIIVQQANHSSHS